MKLLRNLFMFLTGSSAISVFLLFYCSYKLHWWYAAFALVQIISTYVWAEITHTLFKKHRMPHPQSLAFKKEILEKYRLG